ncbi:MAG: ABC transporter ATP-binding protein, partial [Chloroflexota bacterium]
QRRLGITSLYVTHDQSEAMGLSDRIVVMNDGKIEQVGTPPEIYLKPASAFVADFIGRSNFIKCAVLRRDNDLVTIDFFGQTVELSANGHAFERGDMALIVVRPESIRLNNEDSALIIPGSIKHAEYLGTYVEYEVELERGHFISITDWNPLSALHMEGDEIDLYFPIKSLYMLAES